MPINARAAVTLRIRNLSKTYPNGTRALDDVTLDITPGMFGLLGPNGAGKSTLMRTVATLQQPDSGSLHFGDLDVLAEPTAVRRRLGYLPQEFGVYKGVSAVDLLTNLAVLKGYTRRAERRAIVEALLERVNLHEHRKKAVSGYSGGMRQRFGIAQALLGDPSLVIVDEPTAGLDPGERNRFYNLLAEIGESKVVILSTHIVQDVEQLCGRLAIIHAGRLLFAGTPAEAKAPFAGRVYAGAVAKPDLQAFRHDHAVLSERLVTGRPYVHVLADAPPAPDFAPVAPDLEDVFFAHIGGHGGDRRAATFTPMVAEDVERGAA